MDNAVLDAWAVMAYLKDQPAAPRVQAFFDASKRRECILFMNIVNLGEVFYITVKNSGLAHGEFVLKNLRSRISTISADDSLVMLAAGLKARHPISYADAFAAATAMSRSAPLITGDPELQAMAVKEPKLKLEWLGDPASLSA